MNTIFKIVIDGISTNHTFSREGAISLVEKMVELQDELPKSTITFIIITL